MKRGFLSTCFALLVSLLLLFEAPASGIAIASAPTFTVDVKAMDVWSAGPGASVKELMASIDEEWARVWGWKPGRPTTVYLYFDGYGFADGLAEICGETISPDEREYLARYVSGVALEKDTRTGGYAVVMNLGYQWGTPTWEAETRTVLVHEYTHIMLADAAKGAGPTWFNEGMAELMAYVRVQDSPYLETRTHFVAQANSEGWLPTLPQLQANWGEIVTSDPRSAQVAYGASYFAVKYLADRVGGMPLLQVLQRVAMGEDFTSALPAVTGYTVERLDAEYRASIPKN